MNSPAEPTDMVVALPHLQPVLKALDEARARSTDGALYGDPKTSDMLQLALLPLPDPARAARDLRAWSEKQSTAERPRPVGDRPAPGSDRPPLDHVLWHLRAGFAAQYHGWTPTLGKNRAVGEVQGGQRPEPGGVSGAGEVSHGGGGAPRAIDEPTWAKERRTVSPNGVCVALVDTPVVAHQYLAGAWTGPSPDLPDGPMRAEHGHATFIAGLVRRYAPAATLQVHPVLDPSGNADAWAAAHQIVAAGRAGADVLNLSFVCYTDDGVGPLVLAAALERLSSKTVVVAAAGNHGFLGNGGKYRPAFPAAFPNVIAVGADGAGFSAEGAWITVLAPGTDLESTYLDGTVSVWKDPDGPGPALPERHDETFRGYARWSGTSFAAARVSAMIAERTVPGRRTAAEAAARLLGPEAMVGIPVRLP
ncbi:S8 family peptidase [Jidongwangia harbinensis]|uniref:S8 family peptidase n=1 Tax=Jidongwangia harbinensis TaxID=2878561 RepID=UPI001CD98362|nr:S8/S53 family peptidase [Jidongwangia harbinensis]MCA2211378.1 S8/S53 family peptidase [Jidongwangia harbinensis]